MKRGFLVLSGVIILLCAAALVGAALGHSIMPWPAILVLMAMAGGGFVITILPGKTEEIQKQPSKPRVLKQHRPRGRAKKRVVRNAAKRRRFRKMGPILLSHDEQIVHPGGDQVGFFG